MHSRKQASAAAMRPSPNSARPRVLRGSHVARIELNDAHVARRANPPPGRETPGWSARLACPEASSGRAWIDSLKVLVSFFHLPRNCRIVPRLL